MSRPSVARALTQNARSWFVSPGVTFLARAALWVLGLFALIRVPWVEQNLLLPFASFQGRMGCALVGTPPDSVYIGLSCTGADPMALVIGAVLAFPVLWRRRIAGCALGLAIILILNTFRIGSLSLVMGRRELFQLLHVYVWPAVLIAAAAGYVFLWMGASTRAPQSTRARLESAPLRLAFSGRATWRFMGLLALLVLMFFVGSRWIMSSAAVLEMARWATVLAGAVMSMVGVPAEVSGNILRTPQGAWAVTQACIATPLLPVYLAAVLSLPVPMSRRIVAALAAVPLFILLGSARLLVLAIPAAVVGSHGVAVHAFYQTFAAVALVVWLALRTGTGETRLARLATPLTALAAGAACGLLVGWIGRLWIWPAVERLKNVFHFGHAWADPQGAMLMMPAFQFGLCVALWIALRLPLLDRRLAMALSVLTAAQMTAFVVLGELAFHAGVEMPIAALRAASLALPLLVLWGFLRRRKLAAATTPAEPIASRS